MSNLTDIVQSYCVIKHSEDLYCLQINTVDRWVQYHNYSDYEFMFGDAVDNGHEMELEELQKHTLKVEEFLPKGKSFLTTVNQEKDQLCFYYISFDLLRPSISVKRDILIAKGAYFGEGFNNIKDE